MKAILILNVLVIPLVWLASAPLVGYGIYAVIAFGPFALVFGALLFGICHAAGDAQRGAVAFLLALSACLWMGLFHIGAALGSFALVVAAARRWRAPLITSGAVAVLAVALLELLGTFGHPSPSPASVDLLKSRWVLFAHVLLLTTPALLLARKNHIPIGEGDAPVKSQA